MSLFGEDDSPPSSRATKSSLFDDDKPSGGSKTNSSIFADTAAEEGGSPWDFTPRKQNKRGSLVRSLLADADIPESYVDTWDAVAQGGSSVSASEAKALLSESSVAGGDQGKIWDIVTGESGDNASLGRGEFNVLLALIGLAQEGEDLGLDSVDERKKRLPIPNLPNKAKPEPLATSKPQAKSGAARKPSFGGNPWGSPEMHKGHDHSGSNGVSSAAPQRTTSSFTTTSVVQPNDGTGGGVYASEAVGTQGSGAWDNSNAFSPAPTPGFGGVGAGGDGGFGDEEGGAGTVRRPVAPRVQTSRGVEESVTVAILEEKEGMFLFQHRNYEVASIRRNSKVIRRYSDFVWLLDCLHKRYPFRQLPLLPPKRVAINGNHIAADNAFVEKRRRGLARFANALVRHPVLREEQLVVMFLTVPTELAVWRKQATISVQEEFVGKSLPPSLEDSLPQNLQETFETARAGVRRSTDLYINLCNLTERLCKRKEAIAAEYGRFSLNLTSITEVTNDAFTIDQEDVPLLNEGIKSTAKHIGTSQSLLEDEAKGWDEGVLEDLKTVRDGMVSVRDLFDRKDRLARDNIPQLERKIQQNEQKLQGIKAKGELAKPGEAEKVERAIVNDKQSIVDQHARGVFIKECVRDELAFFQTTIHRISRLHQDWAQERVKYSELQADNFRGLVDAVEGMPLGD